MKYDLFSQCIKRQDHLHEVQKAKSLSSPSVRLG